MRPARNAFAWRMRAGLLAAIRFSDAAPVLGVPGDDGVPGAPRTGTPKTSFLDLREQCGATCKYRSLLAQLESRAASPKDPKAR